MPKAALLAITVTATFASLHVPIAQAAPLGRVFVSVLGADAGDCSIAHPCRTFQHAHDVVAPGGEIDVLDPGGYGVLTIGKAISIQGHGFSGISVGSGGTGITISGGVNDTIHLNGLLIDGGGVGNTGILYETGRSLAVENCIVRGLTFTGLAVGFTGANSVALTVSNSYFADTGDNGILLQPNSTGAITASIDRTVLSGNQFAGLNVIGQTSTGGVKATVTDSVAANNTNGNGVGFLVQSDAAHSVAKLDLTRVTAVGNVVGVSTSGSNASVRIGQSTVTNNTTGFSGPSNSLFTYGDNYVNDNESPTAIGTSLVTIPRS